MTNILYAGNPAQYDAFKKHLTPLCTAQGISLNWLDMDAPKADVDYILYAPNGPIKDLSDYPNVKLIQSLWAGVEKLLATQTVTTPVARMVETGLTQGMADYVMGHVLRHHLGTDSYSFAKAGDWDETPPPVSSDRTVGILGIGELGMYCARKLAQFGFPTIGWSRSQKTDDLVECHSGADGLIHVLSQSDILILLLPDTADTKHIIDAHSIATMKDGASIINPGRGPLIDDDALLAALGNGKISAATLDVFDVEPLPVDHPYWAHPKVLVTPHIASATRTKSSCETIAQNIARGEAGQPFLHLVDLNAGY